MVRVGLQGAFGPGGIGRKFRNQNVVGVFENLAGGADRRAGGGQRFEAIRFNDPQAVPDRITAAFRLDINEWNGTQTVQLLVEHAEPA